MGSLSPPAGDPLDTLRSRATGWLAATMEELHPGPDRDAMTCPRCMALGLYELPPGAEIVPVVPPALLRGAADTSAYARAVLAMRPVPAEHYHPTTAELLAEPRAQRESNPHKYMRQRRLYNAAAMAGGPIWGAVEGWPRTPAGRWESAIAARDTATAERQAATSRADERQPKAIAAEAAALAERLEPIALGWWADVTTAYDAWADFEKPAPIIQTEPIGVVSWR